MSHRVHPSETASHRASSLVGSSLTNGPPVFNVGTVVLRCTISASTLTGPKVLIHFIKACVPALCDKVSLAFFNDLPAQNKRISCSQAGLVLNVMPAGSHEDR